MIKNFTDISKLTAYLSSDYKNFLSFYQQIITLLKKENVKKIAFFTKIFVEEIQMKLNVDFWKKNRHKLLFAVPYTVKDTFITKNGFTTGSSKMLAQFKVDENASVIKYINENGGILVGKVHLDEFGAGGSGLFSSVGEFSHPFDSTRIVGGSSSGSVLSLIHQIASFSICSDTGDSARYPALLNGLYGYKPTFGSVSRYGMLSCFAPSLDTVSLISNDYRNFRKILSILIHNDEQDAANFEYSFPIKPTLTQPKKKKIGYFELTSEIASEQAIQAHNLLIEKLKKRGFKMHKIKIPENITKTLLMVYELTAYPGLLSTLSNLNGLNFGKLSEPDSSDNYLTKIHKLRTANFGSQIKQRLIFGTFFLDFEYTHYVQKAHQYRHYITKYISKLLKKYDFLFHLGADLPPTIKETKEEGDNFSVDFSVWFLFANFGGFPSFCLPFTWIDHLPLGINLFTKIGQDSDLIDMGSALAEVFNFTTRFQ